MDNTVCIWTRNGRANGRFFLFGICPRFPSGPIALLAWMTSFDQYQPLRARCTGAPSKLDACYLLSNIWSDWRMHQRNCFKRFLYLCLWFDLIRFDRVCFSHVHRQRRTPISYSNYNSFILTKTGIWLMKQITAIFEYEFAVGNF